MCSWIFAGTCGLWSLLAIRQDCQYSAFSDANTFYSAEFHKACVQLENNADNSQWICKVKEFAIRISCSHYIVPDGIRSGFIFKHCPDWTG